MSDRGEVHGEFEGEIDVSQLIELIKARPELYNTALKEYHNQDLICRLWKQIGAELNVSASQCKNKWQNLRCSYGRYLRDLKKLRSGHGKKRKKWYWSDAMSFMQQYVGPDKNNTHNFTPSVDIQNNSGIFGNTDIFGIPEELDDENSSVPHNSFNGPIIEQSQSLASATDSMLEIYPCKRPKTSGSEMLAEPMVAFLKSKTQQPQHDDHMLLFLKSLHPEVKTLTPKRQRKFKSAVLHELHALLDEQEEEQSPCFS